MMKLLDMFPNAEVLISLPTEELGAKLIFLARERIQSQVPATPRIHPDNFITEVSVALSSDRTGYPSTSHSEVLLAISEAWAWLEAQGLIIPDLGTNGRNGYRVLSRRAKAMESESELAPLSAARMLPKDLLHPAIAAKAWMPFMRGEYDTAVFEAMKQLEILTRSASAQNGELTAVQMVRKAFDVNSGILTDANAERSEKESLAHLFAGAFGVLKNPHSHRNVELTRPDDAASVILFASYLARVVEARAASLSSQ